MFLVAAGVASSVAVEAVSPYNIKSRIDLIVNVSIHYYFWYIDELE